MFPQFGHCSAQRGPQLARSFESLSLMLKAQTIRQVKMKVAPHGRLGETEPAGDRQPRRAAHQLGVDSIEFWVSACAAGSRHARNDSTSFGEPPGESMARRGGRAKIR